MASVRGGFYATGTHRRPSVKLAIGDKRRQHAAAHPSPSQSDLIA